MHTQDVYANYKDKILQAVRRQHSAGSTTHTQPDRPFFRTILY